jgi:DNA-binding transcriptional MerR regulator
VAMSYMIGDLGKQTGTKVNTIRFYESIGLMPPAERTGSGRRVYQEGDVKRLRFIRHGRSLGFATDEIRSLMRLSDEPNQDCAEASDIAQRHLVDVKKRISRLEVLKAELEKVADSCSGGSASQCRVIELIADWQDD